MRSKQNEERRMKRKTKRIERKEKDHEIEKGSTKV